MKTRLLKLAFIATIFSATASAQRLTTPKPVRFKVEKKQVNDNTFDVLFSATIDKGWHVYSPGLPAGGPVSASITIDKARVQKQRDRSRPSATSVMCMTRCSE